MGIDLPLIWAIIIGFGLMMYVIMDGFDLGIGILFPFVHDRHDRDTMVNTIAPVWDGNETWLALGGAALMAAFPLAYSVILSALYLPIVLMLGGLIWRGVAFEFRFKADEAHKPFWDKAFAWGSYIATLSQGVALGAFINGFEVTDGAYSGGGLDWLTPFSLFTGFGLVVAYALLGSTWLVMKTDGALQLRMKELARPVTMAVLAMIAIVSLWTPLSHPAVAARWFSLPNIIFFAPVPILVLLATWAILRTLRQDTMLRRFCSRCSCCSWAIAGSPSACGRTSSRRRSPFVRPRRPRKAWVYSRRGAVRHPIHSRLHHVVLLCLSRQGENGRGLSLMGVRSPSDRRKWP